MNKPSTSVTGSNNRYWSFLIMLIQCKWLTRSLDFLVSYIPLAVIPIMIAIPNKALFPALLDPMLLSNHWLFTSVSHLWHVITIVNGDHVPYSQTRVCNKLQAAKQLLGAQKSRPESGKWDYWKREMDGTSSYHPEPDRCWSPRGPTKLNAAPNLWVSSGGTTLNKAWAQHGCNHTNHNEPINHLRCHKPSILRHQEWLVVTLAVTFPYQRHPPTVRRWDFALANR